MLRQHSDAEGRDYETVERICVFSFDVGEGGEVIGQLRWLADMGIQAVMGFVPGVDRITPLEVIGREVIPAACDL